MLNTGSAESLVTDIVARFGSLLGEFTPVLALIVGLLVFFLVLLALGAFFSNRAG